MGLKKNFMYSGIVTISNYVFPLILYPYISRVLGVANIGICNFVDTVINYFVLLSMMGVSAVGIREISSSKNDQQKTNEVFSSLIKINFIFTVIAILLLIAATIFIPRLHIEKEMMAIGILKLVGNFLLIEWLYYGLEDFEYVTLRTILIKTIYVICVFIFVTQEEDYKLYYLLTSAAIFINAFINLTRSRHYARIIKRHSHIRIYLKPVVTIGIYMILTTMYTTSNIVYLGFKTSDTEVGYYTTASKIILLIMAFYTAWTNVVMPRMSSLLSEGDNDKVSELLNQSVSFLFSFAIPTIILCLLYSSDIIYLLAGKGYEGAYAPFRILSINIFIIGFSQILVMQTIFPMKDETIMLRNAAIGATIGMALNIFLIPLWGTNGASLSWVLSEISILLLAYLFVVKKMNFRFPWKLLFKYTLSYLPFFILVQFFLLSIEFPITIRLTVGLTLLFGYTLFIQYFFIKDKIVVSLVLKVLRCNKK